MPSELPDRDPDRDPDHALSEHHDRGHQHRGHRSDQGVAGALRYLRWLPQMWRSPINDAVVDLVAPRPGERVVDIGAGMGAGVVRAAASGATVVAVEPTPFMRGVLTVRRLGRRRRDLVEIVAGTAERFPVDDRSVDAVWAVNTMHHWSDLEVGAAEIARVLRPGGRALLIDEVFTDPSHPDHERFGRDADHGHHDFTEVDADTMGELLRAAGLTAVEATNRRVADRPVVSIAARGAPIADP